jgi:hypothetical protein
MLVIPLKPAIFPVKPHQHPMETRGFLIYIPDVSGYFDRDIMDLKRDKLSLRNFTDS